MYPENNQQTEGSAPQPPEQQSYHTESDGTQTELSSPAPNHSGQKSLPLIVGSLLAVLLVGIGAIFAKDFLYSSPTVESVLNAFTAVDTYSYSGSASFSMETKVKTEATEAYSADLSMKVDARALFTGVSDLSIPTHPKLKNKTQLSFSVKTGPFQIEDGLSILTHVDGADAVYVTFESLPEIISMFLPTTSLQGKTIRIDREVVESYFADMIQDGDFAQQELEPSEISKNLANNPQTFQVFTLDTPEKTSMETPDGTSVPVTKHNLNFNTEGAQVLLQAMLNDTEYVAQLDTEAVESTKMFLDDILPLLSFTDSELWVGADNLPYKVVINIKVDLSEKEIASIMGTTAPTEGVEVGGVTYAFKTDVMLYDYNKPVTIVYPSDSVSIEEFMGQLMSEQTFLDTQSYGDEDYDYESYDYEYDESEFQFSEPMSLKGSDAVLTLLRSMADHITLSLQHVPFIALQTERSWVEASLANAFTPFVTLFKK